MWLQRILSVLLAVNVFAGLVCLALLFAMNPAVATNGEGTEFSEQEVTVGGAGVQLPGTILVPAGEDPVPSMVLVHGAGPHTQASVRAHAEAFAELGVATLIYDKRQEGYSEFERSYELLAQDAVAAVKTALWGAMIRRRHRQKAHASWPSPSTPARRFPCDCCRTLIMTSILHAWARHPAANSHLSIQNS